MDASASAYGDVVTNDEQRTTNNAMDSLFVCFVWLVVTKQSLCKSKKADSRQPKALSLNLKPSPCTAEAYRASLKPKT